jgi:hypothetical protein
MHLGTARNHSPTKKEIEIIKYLNRKCLEGGKNGNSSKDNGR